MMWIKCSEQMPELGINVLIILNRDIRFGSLCNDYPDEKLIWNLANYAYNLEETADIDAVTHWQPLPELPENDE